METINHPVFYVEAREVTGWRKRWTKNVGHYHPYLWTHIGGGTLYPVKYARENGDVVTGEGTMQATFAGCPDSIIVMADPSDHAALEAIFREKHARNMAFWDSGKTRGEFVNEIPKLPHLRTA
jgi:hypothetical protein